MVFDGFTLDYVETDEATLHVRHGGNGPPLLLLHGHPRTHATWHRRAPLLADRTGRSPGTLSAMRRAGSA